MKGRGIFRRGRPLPVLYKRGCNKKLHPGHSTIKKLYNAAEVSIRWSGIGKYGYW